MLSKIYFQNIYNEITTRQQELNDLDAKLGDGDHGATMARGLSRSVQADEGMRTKKFMRASGGASGTLFGLILHEIELHLDTGSNLATGLQRALDRICDLGQVKVGDKSMVDALAPAVYALNMGKTLDIAVHQAQQGRDLTREMTARRGRAMYVENQGVGHIDPGSVSVVILLQNLCALKQNLQ